MIINELLKIDYIKPTQYPKNEDRWKQIYKLGVPIRDQ